jgi:hypothetical protein
MIYTDKSISMNTVKGITYRFDKELKWIK